MNCSEIAPALTIVNVSGVVSFDAANKEGAADANGIFH